MKENAELFDWSVNVRINKDGRVITGAIEVSGFAKRKWKWFASGLADVDRKSVEGLIGLAGHVMTREEKDYVHLEGNNEKVSYTVVSTESDEGNSTTVRFKYDDRYSTQKISIPWEGVNGFRNALSMLGSKMDEAEARI